MASNPPGECCFKTVKHDGEAVGTLEKIGDTSVYISRPPSGTSEQAILLLSDVFGHDSINTQLVADQFAANGYLVLAPDQFRGGKIKTYPPPPDFNIQTWLSNSGDDGKGQGPAAVDPIVEAAIAELKTKHGIKKIGAVGYCFGAKYVARFAAAGKGIDAAYFAHPSFVDAAELKTMVAPLSIAAAETDFIFSTEKRRETEDILLGMSIPYQITLYSDVEHGFATKGDLSKKPVRFARDAAFLQALTWFTTHLN